MYIVMYLMLGCKVNFGMYLNFYFFWIYNRKRKEELYNDYFNIIIVLNELSLGFIVS